MKHFLRLPIDWFRKFLRENQIVDVGLSGPKLRVPILLSGEPTETRYGSNESDKNTPFYETNKKRIKKYYYAYRRSYAFKHALLYAEFYYFKIEGMRAISKPEIKCSNVTVQFEDTPPWPLPEDLKKHGDEAVKLFKALGKLRKDEGKWLNADAVRISSVKPSGLFTCESASYFDQVATNLTMDWRSGLIEGGGTIRSSDDLERPVNGALVPLEDSNLANTVGTAVMFYDRNLRRALVRTRAGWQAAVGPGLHCTASGALEVTHLVGGDHGIEFFLPGTQLEILRETGLTSDKYLLFPVAFARELPRGGKPQLFYAAVCLVDEAEFFSACSSAYEADEYAILSDSQNEKEIAAIKDVDSFTYEGWACLELTNRFVLKNQKEILAIVGQALS